MEEEKSVTERLRSLGSENLQKVGGTFPPKTPALPAPNASSPVQKLSESREPRKWLRIGSTAGAMMKALRRILSKQRDGNIKDATGQHYNNCYREASDKPLWKKRCCLISVVPPT